LGNTVGFDYYIYFNKKNLKIPKGGNQNPLIEGQTTQCPKEKGQTTIYKAYA
jgi:hypothetical protein